MAGIYSSPFPSPYPIEKIGDSPYPYPYSVNAGIPRQNGDGFGQYPRGRVYLPSLRGGGRRMFTFNLSFRVQDCVPLCWAI